jgi:hypothetical protein
MQGAVRGLQQAIETHVPSLAWSTIGPSFAVSLSTVDPRIRRSCSLLACSSGFLVTLGPVDLSFIFFLCAGAAATAASFCNGRALS